MHLVSFIHHYTTILYHICPAYDRHKNILAEWQKNEPLCTVGTVNCDNHPAESLAICIQ